jgi:hypothetical protein
MKIAILQRGSVRAGGVPLAAVDDVVVAVAHDAAFDVGGVADEATLGSVIAKQPRISPASSGFSQRSWCSGVP